MVSSVGTGAVLLALWAGVQAADPLKVGLLLPYTGTYVAIGEAIANGMKLTI